SQSHRQEVSRQPDRLLPLPRPAPRAWRGRAMGRPQPRAPPGDEGLSRPAGGRGRHADHRLMAMAPLFLVGDMPAAVAFYTNILDFDLSPWDKPDDPVVSLTRGADELMLTALPTDQAARVNAHLLVADIDALFARWTARGLDQSHRTESPVHLGPVDQSW